MPLSVLDFIDINIQRQIEVVARVGFGTGLFIGTSDDGSGGSKQGSEVREYSNFEEVSAVFDTADPEYKFAELYFGQVTKPVRLHIGFKASADTYVEAYDKIIDIDNSWYAVAIESREAGDIELLADRVQDDYKIFLAASDDSGIPDPLVSDDLASELLDKELVRTSLYYHDKADDPLFIEAAVMGRWLPEDPGTINLGWTSLQDVESTDLTKTQADAIESKRATYYTNVAGQNYLFFGQVSSPGDFADNVRVTDWLTFRIAEDLVARLGEEPKVPYVGGDAIIENVIRARLQIAANRGVITNDFNVVVPPAQDQTAVDRANRLYADVTFTSQLTGAVNKIQIDGTLTV